MPGGASRAAPGCAAAVTSILLVSKTHGLKLSLSTAQINAQSRGPDNNVIPNALPNTCRGHRARNPELQTRTAPQSLGGGRPLVLGQASKLLSLSHPILKVLFGLRQHCDRPRDIG
eukprot:5727850-Prymnesium_polylepis.1